MAIEFNPEEKVRVCKNCVFLTKKNCDGYGICIKNDHPEVFIGDTCEHFFSYEDKEKLICGCRKTKSSTSVKTQEN